MAPNIPFSPYATVDMMGAFGVLTPPRPFFRDVFFRQVVPFQTTTVLLDKMDQERRVAPYVDPNLPAKPTKLRGYTPITLQPSYIKVSTPITAEYLQYRMYGEQPSGSISMEARRDEIVRDQLQIMENQISRAEELQSIQAVLTGKSVIQDEYFTTMTNDFARPLSNTVHLTGAATWGQTGVDPLADLNNWSVQVQQVSGYTPKVVIMSPDAFEAFQLSPTVARIMQTYIQYNPDDKVNLAGYPVGGIGNEAQLVGKINQFEIWTYQQYYWDSFGNYLPMMPSGTVVMGDPVGCGGRRLYGAIQDMTDFSPVPRFPKMWTEPDPSRLMISVQSAPLMALGWAEATFCATVF